MFIESLKDNIPTDIESGMKNNLVQAICPFKDDRELKFKSILGNGATDTIADAWLKENFSTRMGGPLKVMCKGEATNAFSKIANLCNYLIDNMAGDF
eukprot:15326863-Ditylum_brightwellii.AAC.2